MSDESRLNPDLKKLEAELGRLKAPSVSINRDDLMYRSGWAAALNAIENETGVAPTQSRSDRNSNGIWPVTAVLTSAAALILGVLLMFEMVDAPAMVANPFVAEVETLDADQSESGLAEQSNFNDEGLLPTEFEVSDSDVIDLVLEIPAGQILKSGHSFQESRFVTEQVRSSTTIRGGTGFDRGSVGQRQLMEEILSNGLRNNPTRTSIFF